MFQKHSDRKQSCYSSWLIRMNFGSNEKSKGDATKYDKHCNVVQYWKLPPDNEFLLQSFESKKTFCIVYSIVYGGYVDHML